MTKFIIEDSSSTKEEYTKLIDMKDGTWFNYENTVFVVNNADGLLAFSICGSRIFEHHDGDLNIPKQDIWKTAKVIRT